MLELTQYGGLLEKSNVCLLVCLLSQSFDSNWLPRLSRLCRREREKIKKEREKAGFVAFHGACVSLSTMPSYRCFEAHCITYIAGNVTEGPATHADVRSTLKTVDQGKMMAEEEKIAVVTVVAVKKKWKAPDKVRTKTASDRCFFSLWDQNALFPYTLRYLFKAFHGEWNFVNAMKGGEEWSELKKYPQTGSKGGASVRFLTELYARQWRIWVSHSLNFHEKRAKALMLRRAKVYVLCSETLNKFVWAWR